MKPDDVKPGAGEESDMAPLFGNPGTTGSDTVTGAGARLIAASTLTGAKVIGSDGEQLGELSDLMLDGRDGHIAYAVLSDASSLPPGDSRRAIPWSAVTLDADGKRILIDASADQLKGASQSDPANPSSTTDCTWVDPEYLGDGPTDASSG